MQEIQDDKLKALQALREPFPKHLIGKLPKPTRAQTEAVRANYKAGVRCNVCGGWHHPDVVHLDYVGHAALTDRLLDCDPFWSWEPLATGNGLPLLDAHNGLWIKLTVCGMTRIGYGNTDKPITNDNAMKEIIGDALRNAAMRFGAALELWHKGDLNADKGETDIDPREEHSESIRVIKECLAKDDLHGAAEAWYELPDKAKHDLWVAPSKGGVFTTQEREIMKTKAFREAK